jgi:hypothetical protein
MITMLFTLITAVDQPVYGPREDFSNRIPIGDLVKEATKNPNGSQQQRKRS